MSAQILEFEGPLKIVGNGIDGPQGGAVGNLDLERGEDLVVASTINNNLLWYQNRTEDGLHWDKWIIAQNLNDPTSVIVGDFDSDSWNDVVVSSISGDRVLLFTNDTGHGVGWSEFTVADAASHQLDGPIDLAKADVNDDGFPDVVIASTFNGVVLWFENVGGVGWQWTQHIVSTSEPNANAVTTADLDQDGDTDILSVSAGDKTVVWHENQNTSGTSWQKHTIAGGRTGISDVTTVDIDNDGDLDVVSVAAGDDEVVWDENRLDEGLGWVEHVVTASADRAAGVAAADLDGDGDGDILAASAGDDSIRFFENLDGAGTSWKETVLTDSADGTVTVWLGDPDGDGDFDAFGAGFNNDIVLWFENRLDTDGHWVSRGVADPPRGVERVIAADVDADGDDDVLTASFLDDKIAWFENFSPSLNPPIHGELWTENVITAKADGAQAVDVGDIDGDDRPDVVAASFNDDTIAWHEALNDEATSWTEHIVVDTFNGATDVRLVDMDNDDDLDILACAYTDFQVVWFENDGTGGGWTVHTITGSLTKPNSILPYDLDEDGDLDVIAAADETDGLVWYENANGLATSWTPHTIDGGLSGVSHPRVADLDNDTDPDIAFALFDENLVGWSENTSGDATAWQRHRILYNDFPNPPQLAVADFDKDGDHDLVSMSFQSGLILWVENLDGSGISWAGRTLLEDGDQPSAITLGDFDNNGYTDIVIGTFGADPLFWFRNPLADNAAGLAWILYQ